MRARRSYIRSAVRRALERAGPHSPPIPVDRIAREHGLRVVFRELEGNLSGFLHRGGDTPLIGVNTHHPKVRQRFTIAHELGHYLLFDTESVHVDHAFVVKRRGELASKGIDREEIEANFFAGELLMPTNLIHADLEKVEPIDFVDDSILRTIARRYEVSVQAMAIRLGDLHYL